MDLKEKIALLIDLQKRDARLDALRAQAADVPRKVAAAAQAVQDLRAAFDAEKKGLQQLQLKRKEKELEVEAKDAAMRKHGGELNAVKSNDAYRALLTEIETAKKEKFALENEILDLMEQSEREAARLKAAEQELRRAEDESRKASAVLEEQGKTLQADIDARERERAQFAAQIPEDIMHRYDFIRESKGGLAIVPIEGAICGGCHMELRPAVINDARKCQDWIICDSCSRILYVRPA